MIHQFLEKIVSTAVIVIMALAFVINVVSAAASIPEPALSVNNLTPPAPPTNLTLQEDADNKKIKLAWQPVPGILSYHIYRSTTQASYTKTDIVKSTNLTSWTDDFSDLAPDSGLHDYYYVVTASSAQDIESAFSNEVVGMPHYKMIWAGTVIGYAPFVNPTLNCEAQPLDSMLPQIDPYDYQLGDPDQKICITGEVEIAGRTGEFGPEPDVWAQFGFGPVGSAGDTTIDLTQWTNWVDADYYANIGVWGVDTHSRYIANFIPENPGIFYYTFRFSTNQGREWVYPYYNPNGQKPDPTQYPVDVLQSIAVFQNTDLDPPQAPSLAVPLENIHQTSILLSWASSTSSDIYAYDIYRTTVTAPSETDWVLLHRTLHFAETSSYTFSDTNLVSNTRYTYRLTALDKNFNKAASDPVSTTTTSNPITFTQKFSIPPFTPEGKISIHMVDGAGTNTLGNEVWNSEDGPGSCDFVTLHQCSAVLTLQENYVFHFRISRGSQDTIQTQADGNSPPIDPSFKVVPSISQDGINRIVANWDDPLVTGYSPAGSRVSPYSQIAVTWNQNMPDDTTFMVLDLGSAQTGPETSIPGNFSYNSTNKTVTFSPARSLTGNNNYEIKVTGQVDVKGIAQISPLTRPFSTDYYHAYLPFTANK